MGKIEQGMAVIDVFLEANIADKFQRLKDGLLFIKSQTDLENPSQTFVMFEKSSVSERMPIFNYDQVIPTAIGTFLVGINLNYTLGASAMI